MKKVLFVATVLKKHINSFHKPYLKLFKENGFEVTVCAKNDYDENDEVDLDYIDFYHDIDFNRSPISSKNLKAYKTLKKIINSNYFDIIHCHTPVGAALTRLAARKSRKVGTRVFYTVHGFHFFKGAPIKYWLLFYPAELVLLLFTDVIITMNDEDYQNAKKFKINRRLKVHKVDGVGIDLQKFYPIDAGIKKKLRKELNYAENDFIMIYVAELIDRKNQKFIIENSRILKDKMPNLKVLLVGDGVNFDKYKKLIAENSLEDVVHLLGFRKDIPKLLQISDVAVSSSKHEGLPVNVIEAMATALPVVVSNCRGNRDLAGDYQYGYVYNSSEEFVEQIFRLYKRSDLVVNKEDLPVDRYSVEKVVGEVKLIYLI